MKKRIFLILMAILLCLGIASCDLSGPENEYPGSSRPSENESERSERPETDQSGLYYSSFDESDAEHPNGEDDVIREQSKLRIHYLDVGQGDSIFIELPDGKTMLIDSGEYDQADKVISFIRMLGYDTIDVVVATHPHSDHIGAMYQVVKSFTVKDFYMPDVSTDTTSYLRLVNLVVERKIAAHKAQTGASIKTDGSYQIDFLAPAVIDPERLNNCSAVILLTYGERRFLFTGDAEIDEENTITADVSCDILKIGHHGSFSSTGNDFLAKANPEYAVISCAKINDYGHPHREIIQKLNSAGINTLITFQTGNITAYSDGIHLIVDTEKINGKPVHTPDDEEPRNWVLNVSSKRIHFPGCTNIADIAEKNKKEVFCTLQELLDQGYTFCGACKPIKE